MIWLLFDRCEDSTRYVRAEPPCWKGELTLALLGFRVVVGWQSAVGERE